MKRLVHKFLSLLKQRYHAERNSNSSGAPLQGNVGYDLRAVLNARIARKMALESVGLGGLGTFEGSTDRSHQASRIAESQIIEAHVLDRQRYAGVERANEFEAICETRRITLCATTNTAVRAIE